MPRTPLPAPSPAAAGSVAPVVFRATAGTGRRRLVPLVLVGLLALSGCSHDAPPPGQATATTAPPAPVTTGPTTAPPPAPATCPGWGDRTASGATAPPLTEVSGLVASRARPGTWWAHNDSGGRAAVYAVDENLQVLDAVTVVGATAIDWEDIAAAPGPDGRPWLWIADTGDNLAFRPSVQLYGIPEPALGVTESEPAVVVEVVYPEGPADVEALAVDPRTGDAYLVAKAVSGDQQVAVVRVAATDLAAGGRVVAPRVASMPWPVAASTGPLAADISADGTLVVVKGTLEALTWLRGPADDVAALLATPVPCRERLDYAETLAIDVDGTGLAIVNEGLGQPLQRFGAAG